MPMYSDLEICTVIRRLRSLAATLRVSILAINLTAAVSASASENAAAVSPNAQPAATEQPTTSSSGEQEQKNAENLKKIEIEKENKRLEALRKATSQFRLKELKKAATAAQKKGATHLLNTVRFNDKVSCEELDDGKITCQFGKFCQLSWISAEKSLERASWLPDLNVQDFDGGPLCKPSTATIDFYLQTKNPTREKLLAPNPWALPYIFVKRGPDATLSRREGRRIIRQTAATWIEVGILNIDDPQLVAHGKKLEEMLKKGETP